MQQHLPLPKYSHTWDVSKVTSYISSLGDNANLSLKVLSFKLVMLLALTRPSRSIDLSSLDLSYLKLLPDSLQFNPLELAKQSRPSKSLASFVFPAFPSDTKLCPKVTLQSYVSKTESSEALALTGNLSYSCHMQNPITPSLHLPSLDGLCLR